MAATSDQKPGPKPSMMIRGIERTMNRSRKRIVLTTFGSLGNLHPYSVLLPLCGARVKEESVRRHLQGIARRIAGQLAEKLRIDPPAGNSPMTERPR